MMPDNDFWERKESLGVTIPKDCFRVYCLGKNISCEPGDYIEVDFTDENDVFLKKNGVRID
jgi:hypothetical protein